MKHIPEIYYRWLPTIYVTCGGLLAAYLPGGLGTASALLLLFVGVAVFNMRLNNIESRVINYEKDPDQEADLPSQASTEAWFSR